MNKFSKIISIVLLFSVVVFSGCEVVEEDPDYSFEVVSTYGTFVGYYKVDGGASKEFSSSVMGASTVYQSFNKTLETPESVFVSATGDVDAVSVSIYIYEKNVLVKSETVNQTTDGTQVTATLYYTFDEDDDE